MKLDTTASDTKQGKVKSKRVKRQAPSPPTQDNNKTENETETPMILKREPSKIEKRIKTLREASGTSKTEEPGYTKEKLWETDKNDTTNNSAAIPVKSSEDLRLKAKSEEKDLLRVKFQADPTNKDTSVHVKSSEDLSSETQKNSEDKHALNVKFQEDATNQSLSVQVKSSEHPSHKAQKKSQDKSPHKVKFQEENDEPVEIRKRKQSIKIGKRIQSLREASTFKKDQKECTAKLLWEETCPTLDEEKESPGERSITRARNISRYKSICHVDSKLNKKFAKEKELLDFEMFVDHGLKPEDGDMKEVLFIFDKIKQTLEIPSTFSNFSTFFESLLEKVDGRLPDKSISLLRSLETRAAQLVYEESKAADGKVAVVLGAGPCGLRLAMELQMLGARTVVVEKREEMTRNNVLRLWPFIMEDLKRLGVRKLYPQLEHGSINHISIRMLQLILMKLALLLGVEVRAGESFESLREPEDGRGWRAVTSKEEIECDIIFCATGCNVPEGLGSFSKKKPEFKMAIAVTANFKRGLDNENNVEEIPGLARQNKMEYFNDLEENYDIGLENIVYFKDRTNYFVMTVKKESLLKNGILKKDVGKEGLLDKSNQNLDALKEFVLKAAIHSTEGNPVKKSAKLECSLDTLVDVSIFNFSELYKSGEASRVIERKDRQLLIGLVGDSLMQPFWPEGLGISRGFLSVWDAAWMARQFSLKPKDKVLEVIAEREKLYSLQKTVDNQLEKNYSEWSIDPATRYPSDALREPYNRSVIEQFDSSGK